MGRGAPQDHENKDSRPSAIFWLIGHNWSPKITYFWGSKRVCPRKLNTYMHTDRQTDRQEQI